MRTHALLAGLALALTACKTTTTTTTTVSGTPRLEPAPAAVAAPAPAPAAYDPSGRWVVGLVAQGQGMEVTLDLTKLSDGTWTGTIGTAQFGTIPLSKVTIEGKRMTATFPVPTGDMGTMTLTFDGDVAEGEWSMPGDGSKVSGKRN